MSHKLIKTYIGDKILIPIKFGPLQIWLWQSQALSGIYFEVKNTAIADETYGQGPVDHDLMWLTIISNASFKSEWKKKDKYRA